MNVHHINDMKSNNNEIIINVAPQTWYGRLLATIIIGLLFWLALFFFTLFLVIGSILVFILIVRVLWEYRKAKVKSSEKIVDVDISISKSKASQEKSDKHQ